MRQGWSVHTHTHTHTHIHTGPHKHHWEAFETLIRSRYLARMLHIKAGSSSRVFFFLFSFYSGGKRMGNIFAFMSSQQSFEDWKSGLQEATAVAELNTAVLDSMKAKKSWPWINYIIASDSGEYGWEAVHMHSVNISLLEQTESSVNHHYHPCISTSDMLAPTQDGWHDIKSLWTVTWRLKEGWHFSLSNMLKPCMKSVHVSQKLVETLSRWWEERV